MPCSEAADISQAENALKGERTFPLQGYLAHKKQYYSGSMPRALCWSYGGGRFPMCEKPL